MCVVTNVQAHLQAYINILSEKIKQNKDKAFSRSYLYLVFPLETNMQVCDTQKPNYLLSKLTF